jgi:putative NADH-flavin reductase
MENSRLAILGASGRTGRHVVEMALARGHVVTAFVRESSEPPADNPALRLVRGDATRDLEALAEAVRGQDVVISALGRGQSFKPDGLIEGAARLLVAAMEREGVRRLVFTSAYGLGETRDAAPLLSRVFIRSLLRKIYADKEAGESIIRESDLDWTFVHPTGLTNGALTGTYRAGATLPLRGFPTISRADVAHCLLSQVDDPTFVRQTVLISS